VLSPGANVGGGAAGTPVLVSGCWDGGGSNLEVCVWLGGGGATAGGLWWHCGGRVCVLCVGEMV
jgi:hypothetical protein